MRPCVRSSIAVLAAWMICSAVADSARGGLFVSPIGGTPYQDWTIVNYVDLAPGAGIVDYRGGNYTYNGHNAIDYTLANFAAMDAGISVNAAAAGTVIAVHDGEYDRWSRVNPNPGHQANYVVIDHGDGIITEYLHLKKHSISVSVGQAVAAGQPIGEVGSSGNSSDAHLHFAVYEHGQVVETYLDPDRWWIDPLPYSGDVAGSLDHGVVNHIPTTAELVDRPVETEVFRQIDGPLQGAFLWMHLHGISAGDTFDAYVYRPDGDLYHHMHWSAPQIRYGWWIAAVLLPGKPDLGTWQIDFQHNGATLVADSFRVIVPEPASVVPASLALVGLAVLVRTTRARGGRRERNTRPLVVRST